MRSGADRLRQILQLGIQIKEETDFPPKSAHSWTPADVFKNFEHHPIPPRLITIYSDGATETIYELEKPYDKLRQKEKEGLTRERALEILRRDGINTNTFTSKTPIRLQFHLLEMQSKKYSFVLPSTVYYE